jgi:hypothetical protein
MPQAAKQCYDVASRRGVIADTGMEISTGAGRPIWDSSRLFDSLPHDTAMPPAVVRKNVRRDKDRNIQKSDRTSQKLLPPPVQKLFQGHPTDHFDDAPGGIDPGVRCASWLEGHCGSLVSSSRTSLKLLKTPQTHQSFERKSELYL